MFSLNSFIDTVNEKKINMDAVMVIQNGDVLGLHRFSNDIEHNVFSITKSYTSTAVGMAIDDGLLKLTDKPCEFFPDILPADADPRWQKVTLEHLLTMTSGHGKPHLMSKERKMLWGQTEESVDPAVKAEWLLYAFSRPMVYEPGEVMSYGNLAPYVAGRMVEKAVGCSMEDFLFERFWQPTGVKRPRWLTDNSGHSFAASDLYLDIRDQIKLGQLYLGEGEYEGKRYLSKAWAQTATSFHVPSHSISPAGYSIDEEVGYGYYFWMCYVPGTYRAYGREGQFVMVIPHRNAVIATQAMHSNVQQIMDAIWAHLVIQL